MGWSLRDSDPAQVVPWLNLQMSRIQRKEGGRMICSGTEEEIIIASCVFICLNRVSLWRGLFRIETKMTLPRLE